ncbi:MAG TPA: tryptophan synthase subunit alpha, partial [Myxococcales bacterium]|nr:tryptophan synthase subunit alpha [Myxococcales bacterium]
GVELVELQFPFSEPIADGPTLARANQEALAGGCSVAQCFELLEKATKAFSCRYLMMGYYNTIFKYGEAAFCQRLAACGASGMIVPDIPLEESASLRAQAAKCGLDWLGLIAPTSSAARLQQLNKILTAGESIAYATARKGVTGKKTSVDSALLSYLAGLKQQIDVPIALGFGLRSASDVQKLVGKCDIAVLGSVLLETYEEQGAAGLAKLLKSLRFA